MSREPILIRVDGTRASGYEAFARCLTIAAALQRRRRPTYFLSQLEPNFLAMQAKRIGNGWLEADAPIGQSDDLAELQQEIRRLKPAGVIIDGDVPQEYLDEISAMGVLLISIDHFAKVAFPSHLVINPLLGPPKESYEFYPGTQLLLGERYTLVRSEIRRLRPTRSQEPAPITQMNGKTVSGQFRAMVALGEDDFHRQTLPLAKMLVNVPKIAKVDVVVRAQHPDLEALQKLAEDSGERIELAVETAEISAKVVRSHFAITSGSGWSLELACVGMPQLVIVQNEIHWPTAQRLEEEGCAECLGWHENVSAGTIRNAVANLVADPLERQAMSRCGRQLIDGRGQDRFVTALELMLHRHLMVNADQVAA